jgi:hypothetical protein
MAEVIFNFEGNITKIQCDINDKIKDIIDKFLIKIKKKEDNFYYLYNGTRIKYDLTFIEQANELDKSRKKMNILVIMNNDENNDDIKPIISKNIICPECKENIRMDIIDYKIKLHDCINNHSIDNILLNEFDELQKIDKTKIINNDDKYYICNKHNKYYISLCNKL